MTTCQSQRLARFLNRLVLVTLVASMTFGLLSPVAATVVQAEAQSTTAVSSSATSTSQTPVAPAMTAGDSTAAATSQAAEQAAAAKQAAEEAVYQAKVQQVKHYQQGFLAGWKAQGDANQGTSLTDPDEKLGFAQGLAANTARANLMGADYADALNQAALAYAAKLGVKAADVDQLPVVAAKAAKVLSKGTWGTGGTVKYTLYEGGDLHLSGGSNPVGFRHFFVDGPGKAYKEQIKTITIDGSITLKADKDGMGGVGDGYGVNMFSDLPNVTSITGLENITFAYDKTTPGLAGKGGNARTMLSGMTSLENISLDYGKNPKWSTGIVDYKRMLAGDTALKSITFNVDTSKIANQSADNLDSPTANPFPFGTGTFKLLDEQKGLTIKIGWLVTAAIKLPSDNMPEGYQWVDENNKPAVQGIYQGAVAEGLKEGQYKTYHLAPLPKINLNYINENQAVIQATPVTQPADGKSVQVPLLDMYAPEQLVAETPFANYIYKDDPFQLKGLTRSITKNTDVAMMPVQAKGRLTDSDVNWYVDMAGTLHIGPGKLPDKVGTGPQGNLSPFDAQKDLIKNIVFDGKVVSGASLAYLFCNLNQAEAIDGLSNLDTKENTNLDHTFSKMLKLSKLDPAISKMDTAKVTNFSQVFSYDPIEKLDLNGWDVSKGKYMSAMFQNMAALNEIHVDQWDTRAMEHITVAFMGTGKLKTLNLQNWDFRKAVDSEVLNLLGTAAGNRPELTELTIGAFATKAFGVSNPSGTQWKGDTNGKTFVDQFDPNLGADTYRLVSLPINMKFRLTDAFTGDPLKGLAAINIIDAEGNTMTLNYNGTSEFQLNSIKLPEGEYTLQNQVVVVNGYQQPTDFKFTVSKAQADATGTQTINVELTPVDQSIIPNTGSNDQLYFYLAVAAMGSTAIAGGVWLLNKRRRELAELLDKIKKLN